MDIWHGGDVRGITTRKEVLPFAVLNGHNSEELAHVPFSPDGKKTCPKFGESHALEMQPAENSII